MIRDENGFNAAVFRFVDAGCPETNLRTGALALCQGSGIQPSVTDLPPSMLGDGPCELPFLEWQVVTLAAMTMLLKTTSRVYVDSNLQRLLSDICGICIANLLYFVSF